MGKLESALYRHARQILKQYEMHDIPFTGIRGSGLINWSLDPVSTVQGWFRQPNGRLEDHVRCFDMGKEQLQVLLQSDEETRESLREWYELCRMVAMPASTKRYRGATDVQVQQASYACSAGMNLLSKQIRHVMDPFGLEEATAEDTTQSAVSDIAATIVSETGDRVLSLPDNDTRSKYDINDAVKTLVDTFYGKLGYKYEPFEWLYEGLDPIMVSRVLEKKKGTPAALALALCEIGSHLKLPLVPMPAVENGGLNGSEMNQDELMKYIETLRPEVGMRLASKTRSGIVPEPSTWILRLCSPSCSPKSVVYIDCKSGNVLDPESLCGMYPSLGNMSESDWVQKSPLRTWQGLTKLVIQAHTRRGESDLVAHWMYIALCLDPDAVEWERALSEPDVQGVR